MVDVDPSALSDPHPARKQSLAVRRSRPGLDLTSSFPPAADLSRPTGSTPMTTPSLEDDSLESSPAHRTPSPVYSMDTHSRYGPRDSSHDASPTSLVGATRSVKRRPSISRAHSAFETATDRPNLADSFWQPPPFTPQILAAREVLVQRRSSDGSPLFPRHLMPDAQASRMRTTTTASTPSSNAYAAIEMTDENRTRNPTVSSTIASSGPLTPSDEEAVHAARFSWGSLATQHDMRRLSHAMGAFDLESTSDLHRSSKVAGPASVGDAPNHPGGIGLMGTGHFGPGVRAKVSEVLDELLEDVPLCGEEDEVVTMCEYGALNSRSSSLMTEMISRLTRRHFDILGEKSNVSFYITHADHPHADFRPISADLALSDAYLSSAWQSAHRPPLSDRVFSAFAGRPRHTQVLPSRAVSAGFSLFDLHWAKGGPGVEKQAVTADQELQGFLRARANEFRTGGLLVMAFIQRTDDGSANRPVSLGSEGDLPNRTIRTASLGLPTAPPLDWQPSSTLTDSEECTSPDGVATIVPMARRRSNSSPTRPILPTSSAPKRDIWTLLTRALAPCIQRLVSCGMIKSDVARHLLALPDRFYPRQPRQIAAVLRAHSTEWTVEYSAGLSEALVSPTTPKALEHPDLDKPATAHREAVHEGPLMLTHPASKALSAGLMGPKVYAEHCIQLVKTLYEHHFRSVLSKRAKLSRSATEWVTDSLMGFLSERIEDGDLQLLELEVCVIALRRT